MGVHTRCDDIDDGRGWTLAQKRQCGLDQEQRPPNVDFVRLGKGFFRNGPNRKGERIRCIVDDNIEPSKVLDGAIHKAMHFLQATHMGWNGFRNAAGRSNRLDRVQTFIWLPRRNHDSSASLRKSLTNSKTNPDCHL